MEEQIVRLLQQRNEKGITLLLNEYGGLMKAIVRKYIAGRPQEIEECMADIVISVWYHIDDYDASKNTLKNWVAAISKFKAIDYLRKLERQVVAAELIEEVPSEEVQQMNWASLLESLPMQERQVFTQYYFEGQSAKQIASTLNEKESWVFNKLSRSRKKLKSIFLKDEV